MFGYCLTMIGVYVSDGDRMKRVLQFAAPKLLSVEPKEYKL